MEAQVSCHDVSNSNLPENVIFKDVITPQVACNQPGKKQTRKWAAWTRQEQESFFNALRLVGKNFEKITCRVQTKNKDQVRHYYYRLVRRMNKLLGPQLSLDAKNSKDTNAAMLRWWSLLEKHSCKASKLHLKPRKFKNLLEALEHQLLKDRSKDQVLKDEKKNTTKRHSQNGDKSLHSVPPHHQSQSMQMQQPLTKLKLQLFPINETIRKALEADNHNPHLELTLSFRKKISSVLEHMKRKWGTSTIASGELTLVPYHGQDLNQKWTQGSVLTAGDVYSAVGSPPIFRLRYGWFMAPPPPCGSHKNEVASSSSSSSVFDWADCLTNISISELLKDESLNINSNCNNAPALPPGAQCPFSCDSFDAAIAAHMSKYTNLGDKAVDPTVDSSIWNADDARDAFAFFSKPHTCEEINKQDSAIEKVAEAESSAKDVQALTDIYWPDSLGALEVDLATPCRYQSNELILSESLNGFSRMLNSSLDAFQNC